MSVSTTARNAFPPRASFRILFLLAVFLALRAFGNLSLAWGTKHSAVALSSNPLAYLTAMLDPLTAAGIAMLIGAMLVRLALLSAADLSFVLPVTAVGYVIATLFGRVFLHEDVTAARWLGSLLIFAGAALVGTTQRRTQVSKK